MSEAVWDVLAMTAAAVAMRPDWDEEDVTGGLVALRNAGRTPTWAMAELCRIAGRDDGYPRELLAIARQPVHEPGTGLPREGLLAQLREELEHHRDTEGSEVPE